MDGVLVDSELISCRVAAACLAEIGYAIAPADVCARFLGVSAGTMLEEIEAETGRRLPPDLRATMRARTLEAYEGQLAPVAGIADMLAALSLRRCVASSSHPERIARSLAITGLLPALEPHLFSSTMVARGKPAPDLFLHAAACMASEPARCVVVEDSVAGATAGHAAGMHVIGFTGGSHVDHETHAPQLLAAGALEVIRDAADLARTLEEHAR